MNSAVYEDTHGRLRPCLLPSIIRNSLLSERVRAERWTVSCRELGEGRVPRTGSWRHWSAHTVASVKGFKGAPQSSSKH